MKAIWISWVALSFFACGPVGKGNVAWTVAGGDELEKGFPASQLKDGWAVQFSKYLVNVGRVELKQGEKSASSDSLWVVDLSKGSAAHSVMEGLAAGRWSVAYEMAPVSGNSSAHSKVSNADIEIMKKDGLSLWMVGQAVKTGVGVVPFDLRFDAHVRVSECTNGVDGTLGLVVPESGQVNAEMTFHAEHLFYDRLGTHRDVQFRFEALAAAAGTDKRLETEELSSQNVFSLKNVAGAPLTDEQGNPLLYSPGSYDVKNLKAFVRRSLMEQPHLNGGGLCSIEVLK